MSKAGEKLRSWRRAQALSVQDAAARVPVSRQTWHSWERGGSIPPDQLMRRVFEITGGAMQPNDFYDLPHLPHPPQSAATAEGDGAGDAAQPVRRAA